MRRLLLIAVVFLCSCREKPGDAPKPKAPEPFKPLTPDAADAGEMDERDAIFVVAPFTPVGPPVPEGVTRVELHGENASAIPASGPLMLVADDDTFLVQVAPLLAKLNDAGREVWLKHPDAEFAYKLTLRDEPGFQTWLEEPVPGKLRIIQRADGFELQTNMGKLPGRDLNGPTVPVRGGKMDLPTLRKGLWRIHDRFTQSPDVCVLPSFGMPLNETARALAANYPEGYKPIFGEISLVYPRPKIKDAGP